MIVRIPRLRSFPIASLLAALCVALPAHAQVSVSAGFNVLLVPLQPTLPDADGLVDITGLGATFTLQLYVRTDGAEGLFAWMGDITSSEPLLNNNALRVPYTFSPTPGVISADGMSITGVDAAHNPLVSVVWNFGDPMPDSYSFPANGVYEDLLRFRITLADTTTPRDIVISASGLANVVTEVGIIWYTSPEDPPYLGSVTFAPQATVLLSADATITLRIVPAPAALALLPSAGLLAARRRRARPYDPSEGTP